MNDLLKEFIAIENFFNEKTRVFINSVQSDGVTWPKYERQETAINEYYYRIHSLFLKYNPNLISLLDSNDSLDRRLGLKLIKDSLLDFSSLALLIEKLISVSVVGNDEEKKLARNILISRGWISGQDLLIKKVISSFDERKNDYYLYADIGDFLYVTHNIRLLTTHVKEGMASQDEDIIELANDLALKSQNLILP